MRRVAALGLLLVLAGCASAVKTVATAQNTYAYRESRFEDSCVVAAPPTECAATQVELKTYEKHLHEAAAAIKWGGGLPLQLAALKADAKKLAKRTVTK